jgi:simple sugar transport system permease protein
MNVNSEALSAYKAVVVIVLVVLSTPIVRKKLAQLWAKIAPKKEVA